MSWFLVILFLSLKFGCLSEAGHDKKLPSAVVVGTVYCDTCFQQDFSMGSHFISGASVAVECKDGSSKPRFRKEVKTNEHGEFRVQLPFSVSKHVKRIKGCTVELISSSEPYCAVASAATSSSLSLKSRKQGLHIFSAGFFSFKPLKQPNLCNQKPSIQDTKEGLGSVKIPFPPNFDPSFPPPVQDPNTPGALLPGVPPFPTLPRLPPLPPLPGIPAPWSHVTGEYTERSSAQGSYLMESEEGNMTNESNPTKTSEDVQSSDKKLAKPENLPPNPFFPPPIVPNPFQPPPLVRNPLQPPNPTPLTPNPFQPPPSGPSPLPPVSGLSPSPPPTPLPSFPFPVPPLFPPPSIPGTPPASSTKNASP